MTSPVTLRAFEKPGDFTWLFDDAEERAWDESQHPRDEHGQWTDAGSGGDEDYSGTKEPSGDSESEQIMSKAREAADYMGFDADKIEISDKLQYFKVGNKQQIAVANYNPGTGKITLYSKVIMVSDVSGTIAHEIEHEKFRSVLATYLDESENNPTYGSTYRKLAPYLEWERGGNAEKLMRTDGITRYSKHWWQSVKKEPSNIPNAIGETLAEIASVKTSGKKNKIAPVWEELYSIVNQIYGSKKKK